MTYLLESYDLLERMSKRFKVGDNAMKTVQRTASIVNNSNSEQSDKDSLCANMISEVVKVAAERVNNKGKQRTASVTSTSKIDEVLALKKFMKLA